MTMDIHNFYLDTPMKRYESMFLPYNIITPHIIKQYHLQNKVHLDEKVYIEIQKGMYGFPQEGEITNNQLQQHLGNF